MTKNEKAPAVASDEGLEEKIQSSRKSEDAATTTGGRQGATSAETG